MKRVEKKWNERKKRSDTLSQNPIEDNKGQVKEEQKKGFEWKGPELDIESFIMG